MKATATVLIMMFWLQPGKNDQKDCEDYVGKDNDNNGEDADHDVVITFW